MPLSTSGKSTRRKWSGISEDHSHGNCFCRTIQTRTHRAQQWWITFHFQCSAPKVGGIPLCEGIGGDSGWVSTLIKGTCRVPACSQTHHTWPALARSTPKWGPPHFPCTLVHQSPCFPCSPPWLWWGLRWLFLPFLLLRIIICLHYQALPIHVTVSQLMSSVV